MESRGSDFYFTTIVRRMRISVGLPLTRKRSTNGSKEFIAAGQSNAGRTKATSSRNIATLYESAGQRPRLDGGRLLFHGGIDRGVATVREQAHGGIRMNQNAKRNLQRRKRQANRLSKREYFKAKKEALNVAAAAKDKAV